MNRLAVSFLSLLALTPTLLAQDGAHDLSTKVKAGTTVWFAEQANNESAIDMGGNEMTTGQKLTRTFRITVKELTAEGSHIVEIEVARIHGTLEFPMVGEMQIDSAATGDEDADEFGMQQIADMKQKLTASAGKKFLARVGGDGKVVGAVRALDKDGKESDDKENDGEDVQQLIESAFGLRPKTKVDEGATWDYAQDKNNGQMPMKAKAKAKLVKVSDDLFETATEGTLEKNAAAKAGGDAESDEEAAMRAEMLDGMTIENGKLAGTQHLSRKDGLLVDSSTTMSADIGVETPFGSMSMKMKTVTTIKRITEAEARPAKKAEKTEDGDK